MLCPENFIWRSECFGGVVFYDIPTGGGTSRPVNYSIVADSGLYLVDVEKHNSAYEKIVLPLQWAIDKVRFCITIRDEALNVQLGHYRASNWHSAADTARMAVYARNECGQRKKSSTQLYRWH